MRAGNRSLSLYDGLEARLEISVLHNHMALTFMKLGNLKKAGKFAELAAGEAKALDDDRSLAWVIETLAEIVLAAGKPQKAVELCSKALALGEKGASPEPKVAGLLTAARAHQALHNTARRALRTSKQPDIAESTASGMRRRQFLAACADFLTETGDDKAALSVSPRGRGVTRRRGMRRLPVGTQT